MNEIVINITTATPEIIVSLEDTTPEIIVSLENASVELVAEITATGPKGDNPDVLSNIDIEELLSAYI